MSRNQCLPFVMEFIFYFTQKSCMKSVHLAFKIPKMRYGMLRKSAKDSCKYANITKSYDENLKGNFSLMYGFS